MSIRYSVIIPTYNRAHQLIYTLASYAAQTYDRHRFEVIVVDDGSTDDTSHVVRHFRAPYKLTYLKNSSRKSAATARNRGVAIAKGKYLIFNDADFLVYPHFLETIHKYHKRNRRAIISPWPYNAKTAFTHYYRNFDESQKRAFRHAIRKAGIRFTARHRRSIVPVVTPRDVVRNLNKVKKLKNESPSWATTPQIKKVAHQTDVAPFFSFITRCIALRKKDFEAVGGFCEEFKDWGLEDQELGYRLHKRGVPYTCLRTRIGLHQEHPNDLRADNAVNQNLARWFRRAGFNDLELTLQFMIDPWDPKYKNTLRHVAKHSKESSRHRRERHDLRRRCRKLAQEHMRLIPQPENRTNMRVYFYSEALSGRGGMETVLSAVSRGLMRRGHEVRIILDAPSAHRTWEKGLPITYLTKQRGSTNQLEQLRSVLNRLPCPDVIITMEALQTAVARKAVKTFSPSPKIISWVHFSPHVRVQGNSNWVKQIGRADAHIAICKGVAEQLTELTPPIPSYQVYSPLTRQSRSIPRSDKPTFLYVGRLFNYQKRIDRILTALSEIQGDWRLKVIGDGQDKEMLYNLSRELHIHKKIDWIGWRRKPWIGLESATCLVMSSDYEGFGMVAVEALSRGIPVVLADCPTGPSEIVQEGVNGWLFPPDNIGALRDILGSIVNGSTVLPSADACKQSVRHFRERAILNQFEDLLKTLSQP